MISRLVFTVVSLAAVAQSLTVENGFPKAVTKYGTIYGLNRPLPSDKAVYTFTGIPFAKPPVGNLRFEKSVPPEPFGELNATTEKDQCTQFVYRPSPDPPVFTSEDCLYLNIAAPNYTLPGEEKFPVMVFVFGGGFVTGNGKKQFCTDFFERFVTEGIVYVTINYRLGPLGFYFSEESPGNYGLWDQIQSLRFIREIISEFNGDPEKITLFGTSAGGASVSWLTHSPVIGGLIKQAIPYCGTSHCMFARTNNTYEQSKHMEKELGCDTAANKKECLQGKSLQEIVMAEKQISFLQPDRLDDGWWSPRIDGELIQGTDMKNALTFASNITCFYGMNSMENQAFAMNMMNSNNNDAKYTPVQNADAANFSEDNMEARMRYLLDLGNHYGDKSKEAIDEIVTFYKNEAKKYEVNPWLQTFVQFSTDVHWNVGSIREVRQKAEANRVVYYYMHDFRLPNYTYNNPLLPVGNSHCQENPYIFGNYSGVEPKLEGEFLYNMQEFVKMWLSFVKTGVPVHSGQELRPATATNVPYAHIQATTTIKDDLWGEIDRFWTKIAADYGFDWVTGNPEAF